MRVVGSVLAVFVVLFGLSWIIQGNDWFMYSVFAPKYEQVRRNTFEQSQAYNDGMIRDLENIKLQYDHTDNEVEKAGLKATFLHRVNGYSNKDQLPSDLRNFYYSINR